MPYNQIVAGKTAKNASNRFDENGGDLSANDSRYGEKLYITQGTNDYYFGMEIEARFTQQKNGRATYKGVTEDMIYEFNGDDDLWVFIDGVLVLDIGGVHDAHSGKINFANGTVEWYDCETGKTPEKEYTTIKAMFQEAGVFPDGSDWVDSKVDNYFRGDTFKDYTDHTFQMFYFERGAGASNLHVKFNLPVVPKNTINIQKVVETEAGVEVDYAEDIDFRFRLSVNDELYAYQSYKILENNIEVDKGETDDKGEFTLKHGQTARFPDVSDDAHYQVQELGATLNGYEVKVNGTSVWSPGEDDETDVETIGADSGPLSVSTNSTAAFTNIVTDTVKLSIEKKIKDDEDVDPDKKFSIQLKLGNELYEGSYKIGNTTYDNVQNGIIQLKANETATISGLPYGVTFDVVELLDGSYYPTYAITGKDGDLKNIIIPASDNEASSASAEMYGDGKVTVTNEKLDSQNGTTTVKVNKTWDDSEKYDLPPYITVTLYEDTNADGKWDSGDTKLTGYEEKKLNEDNNWSAQWSGLPADTNYIVKETYPVGYEEYKPVSITNEFDGIAQVGDRIRFNNTLEFKIGQSKFLFIKRTDGYSLWTPTNLNLSASDIKNVGDAIKDLKLNGAGGFYPENLEYMWGEQTGRISLVKQNDGWKLTFGDTSMWSMFWVFDYTRTQSIRLTNTLDSDAVTSVNVEKVWDDGGNSSSRPTNVTVKLYQDGNPYNSTEVVLNTSNSWKHTFENLPVYYQKDNKYVKHEYTVKESKIENDDVANNMAAGYEASVSGGANSDGTWSYTVTNTKLTEWQIIKVSTTGNNITLEGAVFQLSNADNTYYGKSDQNGVVGWYTDEACETEFTGVIPNGSYTLTEIIAPDGYQKGRSWTVKIERGAPIEIKNGEGRTETSVKVGDKDTYYYKNEALYSLPSAGGPGIFLYMIGGTLLLIAGSLMIYINRRKGVLEK